MNSVRRFETHSDVQTRELGRTIARDLPKSGTVLLIGNLGAGKTTLTKGIAEGLGAATADAVLSPTFTLIHEYGTPVQVYHVDLYRLDTAEEARRLGIEDLFDSSALVILEWAERFPELLPEKRIEIRMSHTGETSRCIEISTTRLETFTS
jgi:tRNA threonylcarbamoyladenosine biosynthesis protein TsaE